MSRHEIPPVDCRVAQLTLLNAMYPNQLECDNPEIKSAIENESYNIDFKQPISGLFTIDPKSFEVFFVLPVDNDNYDDGVEQEKMQLYCRIIDANLTKSLQKKLNEDVKQRMINDGDNLNLTTVLQELIQQWEDLDKTLFFNSTVNNCLKTDTENDPSKSERNTRFWIYSHHIKSTVKRKLIIDLCSQFNLNGFMLIGKPGFICIEGYEDDCHSFWNQIRSWTWQRISLIETESLSENQTLAFDTFEEVSDRSAIFRIMETKNCDSILKEFLGFNNKN